MAPEVFGLLDFEDDDAFLEPMAFVVVGGGESSTADVSLVYAGAISADRRPDLDALSDEAGRIFVPGLGYFSGLPPRTGVRLVRSGVAPFGYSPLEFQATATSLVDWQIGDSRLSLLAYPIAALSERVAAEGGRLSGLEDAATAHRDSAAHAFCLLAGAWPLLAGAIERVVRHLVLFEDAEQNSFATPAAHGIAFLNVHLGQTEWFFVEDLAHQCGHVLFTAAWEGSEPLLTVPSETQVEELIGREDHRTLEVAVHGMVTQALMVCALERVARADASVGSAEATARMLFALLRLGLDLRILAGLDVYSDAGAPLIRELISVYSETAALYRDALLAADFRGQPYNLDYDLYRTQNAASYGQVTS